MIIDMFGLIGNNIKTLLVYGLTRSMTVACDGTLTV